MGFSMQGWEHDLDRYLTTDPRDEEEPLFECSECGCGIYNGEEYYKIGDKCYCTECMDGFKKEAEPEEWFGEE